MTPPEFSVAFVTSKGLLPLVDEDVSFELVGVGEARQAYVTFVGPFASMDPKMAPEVGNLNKLPVTVRAAVGLFTGMQPHVGLQMVVPRETFVTDLALKRFFPSVRTLMIL